MQAQHEHKTHLVAQKVIRNDGAQRVRHDRNPALPAGMPSGKERGGNHTITRSGAPAQVFHSSKKTDLPLEKSGVGAVELVTQGRRKILIR